MPEKKSSAQSKSKQKTTRRKYTKKATVAKPNGVGDKVEEVLASKPIKPIVEKVKAIFWKEGEDCGCDERKEKLNKLFKGRRKRIRCLTEKQYQYLHKTLPKVKLSVEYDTMVEIKKIHSSVFNYHYSAPCGTCGKVNRRIVDDMRSVYSEYKSELEA